MVHNNLFNLMNQMVQESKSLWRIKNEYMKDAKASKDVKALWAKMAKDKADHIQAIKNLVAQEIGKKK